jgi:hypothetical protein
MRRSSWGTHSRLLAQQGDRNVRVHEDFTNRSKYRSNEIIIAQTAHEIFVVGLRNAHAMEIQARELMERQSERPAIWP